MNTEIKHEDLMAFENLGFDDDDGWDNDDDSGDDGDDDGY